MRLRQLLLLGALAWGSAGAAFAGGDLAVNWMENYGDWSAGPAAGSVPANWYPAAADGRVFLKGLPEGYHTLGLSRAFGLGPLVMPRVWVADGKTTQLDLGFHTDYYAPPGDRSMTGNVFIQPFVATGDSIIKAAALFATPPEPRRAKYSIWEAGPGGARVGEEAFRSPELTAYVGAWGHGQVPVTPGRMYYLRVEGGKGALLDVRLSDAADPALPLVVDGQVVPGAALAGWVESDPPGVITNMASVEGFMRDDPKKDACQYSFAQTFVAKGTSLALVDFYPYVPDAEGDIEMIVRIRQNDTKGTRVGDRRVTGPNGSVLQVVWEPGQVKLVAGRQYCVEILRGPGGGFRIHKTANLLNPEGNLLVDDVSIAYADLDMNIVEYGPDATPPAPPDASALSGDGLTRIQYTAPDDLDVRKLQIRYRQGGGVDEWPQSPAQDHLLAEIDVVPGQTGVIHHTGLTDFEHYTYAAYALDLNGNYSVPAVRIAWPGPGPVLPAQATVVNGTFSQTAAQGARAPGWEIRVDGGEPGWQAFTEGDGTTAFGWTAGADSSARLFQTLTLSPGRKYRVTVKARGAGTASAAIQPQGAPAPALIPLGAGWQTLQAVFTANRPDTDVFLVGATTGAGEVRFTDLRVRDVSME
jgi:hypothetical protein